MISNIKYDKINTNDNFEDDSLQFEIDNTSDKYHYSFVNAVRRSVEENLETYIIDEIEVETNNSIFNNDILIHRVQLLPLMLEKVLSNSPEDIIVSLNITNKENLPIQILSNDIKFSNKLGTIENLISYKNIVLLNNISTNCSVIFKAKLKKGLSGEQAMFKHTYINKYYFKEDTELMNRRIKEDNIQELDKITDFKLSNNSYLKNENGNPKVYVYDIKSNGIISVKHSLKTAIEILINKLKIIKNEIKLKSENYFILPSEDNPNIQIFNCLNETSTIGNLFSYYLSKNELLKVCTYLIPHPLKNELLIKFIFNNKDDSNKENCILILNKEIDLLIDLFTEFHSFF